MRLIPCQRAGLRLVCGRNFHYVLLHIFYPVSPFGDVVFAIFPLGFVVCHARRELGCPWLGLDHRRSLWQCPHRGDHRPAVSRAHRRSVFPLGKSHGCAAFIGRCRTPRRPVLRDPGEWRHGEKPLPRPHALLHADPRLGQYHRVFQHQRPQ